MEYSDEQYEAVAEQGDHIEAWVNMLYATGLLAALFGLIALSPYGWSGRFSLSITLIVMGTLLFFIGYAAQQVFRYVNAIHFYTDVMEGEG